jgi:hypothetical protein
MKKFIKEKIEVLITESITCDVCKQTFEQKDVVNFQEMLSISFTGGFGSIFGDGAQVSCDICQKCLNNKLGDYIKVK